MDGERLRRIRNWQSDEWYAALIIRPACIVVMLAIADWTWLSPNMLTTLSLLLKGGAGVLILVDERWAWITAAIVLQLGLLVDNLDGTLARYRGKCSLFGSFYDKVGDALLWFGIVLAVGWRAMARTGDPKLLALAAFSGYALLMCGYMKWLVEAERERGKWWTARDNPSAAVADPVLSDRQAPPTRTRAQWFRWFLRSWAQIYRFEEVDLFFWVGLALILNRPRELCWVLGVTQSIVFGTMIIRRGRQIAALDRARRGPAEARRRRTGS